MFNLPKIDMEEMSRLAAERFLKCKQAATQPGRFIGVSLGAWLTRVHNAGVLHVPATKICEVDREVWIHAADGKTHDQIDALASAIATQPPGWMVRLDPCSGYDLKHAMSQPDGTSNTNARAALDVSDPRAFDIVYDYPADVVPVWARPWVPTRIIDGYPVEFRVFVSGSVVCGVASYYPQRPLPKTDEMFALAIKCAARAKRIVDHLTAIGEYPWMPTYKTSLVNATMDFLIREGDDEPVFLEAGPPFGHGAHPCAFLDRPISGVALQLEPGVELR